MAVMIVTIVLTAYLAAFATGVVDRTENAPAFDRRVTEDARVSDAARGLRLEEEARRDRPMLGHLTEQHLQRKDLVHAQVEDAIDRAHATTPELLVESILRRDDGADA